MTSDRNPPSGEGDELRLDVRARRGASMVFVKLLMSGALCRVFIEGSIAEHREKDVGTPAGESDDCLVMPFS